MWKDPWHLANLAVVAALLGPALAAVAVDHALRRQRRRSHERRPS